MKPILLFPIAIFTPFLLTIALLGPVYAAMLGASYIIYMPGGGGVHPLADRLLDVFYILDVYLKLFNYWLHHITSLDFVHYTLPVAGLPLLGILLALFLTYKLVSGLLNIFRLSATI